jgi:Zn ribbon nucleic-acid-binding protein
MTKANRFQDENLILSNFYHEVFVVCPSCSKKAIATVNLESKIARLLCIHCGFNKEIATSLSKETSLETAANQYFQVELWLKTAFKNDVFWAYNDKHLDYLERYISATLREHKDRTHFTLLEKLPKFYHEAKNRDGLLKIIAKLKNKLKIYKRHNYDFKKTLLNHTQSFHDG